MPNFETTVEFEVFCGSCGAGLCSNTRTSYTRGVLQVTVEPCDRCLSAQFEEGKVKGYEEAKTELSSST